MYQRCRNCGRANFEPAAICRWCTSDALEWQRSAGLGTIYSWTIAWRPQAPTFETPYSPIIVDMDEGYQILSNLIECDAEDVHTGMRVEAVFESFGEITLPYFRPSPR
jgi:uncharacterized OB-fold protein